LAILDAAPYGFQLPLRGGAGLLELGECFGQIVVAHVPLGGEAQVAAPFLLDLGRLLDLPYLHRNGDAEELRARGMPLGLMPGMRYEEKETILEAGEVALFYSDGLVEAHDPKGEMFGFPRLRALIAEHGEERSFGDFLLEELYSFTGEGWEQEDDITLLALQRSATRS
jgi:hypothetical protein